MDHDGGLDQARLQAGVDAYEAAAAAHDAAIQAHNRVLDSLTDHPSDDLRLLVEKVHIMSTAVACVERLEEFAAERSALPPAPGDETGLADLGDQLRAGLSGPFEAERLRAIEILGDCAALPSIPPPPRPAIPGDPQETENAAVRDARRAVADAIVDRDRAAAAPYRSMADTIEMLTPMMELLATLVAYVYALDRLKARAEELGGLDPDSQQQLQQDRAGRVAAFEEQRLKTIGLLEELEDPFELAGRPSVVLD